MTKNCKLFIFQDLFEHEKIHKFFSLFSEFYFENHIFFTFDILGSFIIGYFIFDIFNNIIYNFF